MSKFTDLPVATASKDNDIVCIVDPDANISAQMTLAVFREQAFSRDILYGAAIQGLLLPSGGALQQITGYANGIPAGGGTDPIAGTITISNNTSGLIKITVFIAITITDPSNSNNNLELYIRKFDGVATTDQLIHKIFTTSTSIDHVIFSSTLILDAANGDAFSLQLSSTLLDKTVNIDETTFIQEAI